MEKNEETTMEEKVNQKSNGGVRSTYLKLLCSDYHLMEACLRSFYGGWIFEKFLQWLFSTMEMQRKTKEKR